MTRDEAVKLLQATRLMLMDGANQPISDLYYALDMAIEALEQTEPQSVCPVSIVFFCDECHREKCDRKTEPNCSEKPNNCEPQTERSE